MRMNLLQKYNEYEKARSELIADMRKLRNEILSYIEDNEMRHAFHYEIFPDEYDLYPNDDEFDIGVEGGCLVFYFSVLDRYDDYECTWSFTYQPHWKELSVEEIVADIVNQSKELFDLQRKRAIDEIKRQAEELGISVSEGGIY